MVWHPLIKNNQQESFKYRVVPFDVKKSVFYERISNCCFVDANDRMPFYDSIGLSEDEKLLIAKWISNGAKDIFGNVITAPQKMVEVYEMKISYLDKNGITNDNPEYIVNSHQEDYTRKIPSEADNISISIRISSSDEFESSAFSLSLYADSDYTDEIAKINTSSITPDNHINFVIKKEDLKNHEMNFFRLNIHQENKYSYPNTQMYSMVRFRWSFNWKNK